MKKLFGKRKLCVNSLTLNLPKSNLFNQLFGRKVLIGENGRNFHLTKRSDNSSFYLDDIWMNTFRDLGKKQCEVAVKKDKDSALSLVREARDVIICGGFTYWKRTCGADPSDDLYQMIKGMTQKYLAEAIQQAAKNNVKVKNVEINFAPKEEESNSVQAFLSLQTEQNKNQSFFSGTFNLSFPDKQKVGFEAVNMQQQLIAKK